MTSADPSAAGGESTRATATAGLSVASDEARPPLRQRLAVLAVCMGLVLGLYVLSAGPMAGLNKRTKFKQFESALQIVYGPLVFLSKRVKPVGNLLKWYTKLFN